MIGAGKRDKTLRMLCRRENTAGIVDSNRFIGRRMEDQERLAKLGNAGRNLLLGNVVEQGATDAEGLAGERHLDFAFVFYVLDAVAEQAGNMGRIERRGDGL